MWKAWERTEMRQTLLCEIPKKKSVLGRPVNTWENNIKMYIKETEQYGVD
jgi:hypothetical protein